MGGILHYLGDVVRRTIIDNNPLVVVMGLREFAGERFLRVSLSVAGRNTDRHFRRETYPLAYSVKPLSDSHGTRQKPDPHRLRVDHSARVRRLTSCHGPFAGDCPFHSTSMTSDRASQPASYTDCISASATKSILRQRGGAVRTMSRRRVPVDPQRRQPKCFL
jgi:hypothetical protein